MESVKDTPRARLEGQLGAALRYSVAQNSPFLLIVIVYITLWNGWRIVSTNSYQVNVFNQQFFTASLAFVCVSCLIRLLYLLIRKVPEKPLLEAWRILRGDVPYLCLGVPLLLVIPAFFNAFGQIKGSMHLWIPIYADPYLLKIDRLIFTIDAWTIFPKIIYHPIFILILDRMYVIWFLVMYCAVFSAAFMLKNPQRRFLFFMTYFLLWIIWGNLVANFFDSAGPCFYSYFYGSDIFASMCRGLQRINDNGHPLFSISTQEYLLDQYKIGNDAFGQGISAFPSMHIAMSVLIAMFFYDINKVVGVICTIFCAIIFVSSIILGWHYAIDGIASLFAVPIFWRLSKWIWVRSPMSSFQTWAAWN